MLSDPSSLWRGVEGIVEIASSIAKAIEADRLKEKSCDDAPITRSRSSSLPRDLQKAAFLEAGKEKDDCMQHKLMRSSVSASNLKCIPLYDMCTGLDTSIDGFGDYDNDEDMYINELKYTRNSSQCCSECFKHQWSLQLISQQKSRSGNSHYSTSAVVDVSFDDDNNNSDVDNIEEKDDILLSTDKRVIKMGEMKDFDHIFDSSLGDLDHDVIDSERNHNSSATAVTSQHVDQINAITINSKSANCSDPSISSADDGTATIAALRDFENQATFMAGLHENNQSTRSTIAVMGAQYRHSMKAVSNSQQHFQFAIRICLTHSGKKALQSYQGLSDDAINSLGRSKVNEMDASLIEQQFDEDALAQAYASSSQRLLHWLESSQESASMFHFTIFRDFQSLRAFQYDIQHLLLATGMHPPQFPPLVNVAGMLDDFLRASKGKKGGEKEKLNFYLASATMNKNKAEVEESEARLYTYILQIQEYLQGVFVLIKAIDEDSRIFHESATAAQAGCVEAMFVDDTSPGILKHVEDSDNLSLAAERGKSNKMTRPVDKKTLSLLVGKFLLGGGANNSHRKSPIASTDDEPSWFPFVAHSLRLVVDGAGSTSGSALLLKNQEELLLRQRSRCIGCGETLVSNFIGLRKNYRQCRFHGGLFCKRWCHYSEKRIIPYRLLFYWDNKPLPVCNQSAIFIDSLLDKCLFKLDRINPLLYDGVPTLRLARALRQKIAHRLGASARHTLLDFETIIDASSRSFGLSRYIYRHTCVSLTTTYRHSPYINIY